jgi:hypothetical protein
MSRTAVLVFLVLCACNAPDHPAKPSSTGSGAPAVPATAVERPAARQFAAWLEVFNSGDRTRMLAYHDRHFPYAVANWGVANVDREESLSHRTGGFEVKKTENRSVTHSVVILKERRSDQFVRVELEVTAAEPHRVARFEILPISTPDEYLTEDERKARTVDDAQRRMLIDKVAKQLEDHYVFPDKAEKMNAALRRHLKSGDYDEIGDSGAFAEALTKDLRAVSHDRHLWVRFGRRYEDPEPTTEENARFARSVNFGFGPIERLKGNVAHVVINGFPPSDTVESREAIAILMTKVADADALLVDLRENGGGDPDTVALVASYVFDEEPVHLNDMYSRETNSVSESWTLRDLKGARFGGRKPVYVLTSKHTFSGGEEFAYDLQSLRRAKVVGDTTGGGAHPVRPRPLDEWFTIGVPWGRPINPITKTNWEGVGVVPDIKVSSDAALDEAYRRALDDTAAARSSRPGSTRGIARARTAR